VARPNNLKRGKTTRGVTSRNKGDRRGEKPKWNIPRDRHDIKKKIGMEKLKQDPLSSEREDLILGEKVLRGDDPSREKKEC